MTTDVFIVDAVRTPVGKHSGALAAVRPDDLAGTAVKGLVDRHPDLDPARIEDVYFGDANGAGEDNRNVARMAALLAGLPTTIPGATVNRLCGSGLEAVIEASRAIATGDAGLCIAGGVESMSRAPWVFLKPEKGYARTHEQMWSTTLGWRMTNPKMPEEWTVSLGEGAEILADRYSISREEQDTFAYDSHMKAAKAWSDGRFDTELVQVLGRDGEPLLERDESIREDTTLEKLAKLKPVFRPEGGTVTAGNASPLNDGASALLLADQKTCDELGLKPMARIAGRGVAGVDPHLYGIGPVEAAKRALTRTGIGWDDVDVVELNEAFAAQSLACLRDWPELDPEKVNPNGGAIALGHPLGCSGAKILTTLVWELNRRGSGYGMATMCIGVGQGIALLVEA